MGNIYHVRYYKGRTKPWAVRLVKGRREDSEWPIIGDAIQRVLMLEWDNLVVHGKDGQVAWYVHNPAKFSESAKRELLKRWIK